MSIDKKKNKKSLFIVIGCGIVGVLVIGWLAISSFNDIGQTNDSTSNDALNTAVVSETGEASELNTNSVLDVPVTKKETDSIYMTDEMDQRRRDSLNKANAKDVSLSEATTKDNTVNSDGLREDMLSGSSSSALRTPSLSEERVTSSSDSYSNASRWNTGSRTSKSRVSSGNSSYSNSTAGSYSGSSNKPVVENNNVVLEDFFAKEVKDDDNGVLMASAPSFQGVIHNTQTISNGDRVQIRILSDININGVYKKANSFIYAFAKFNDNRVLLNIPKLNNTNVKLNVYDSVDGFEGLYVQGAANSDDAKEIKGNAVNDITQDIPGLSTVPGARALSGIFSKRVRESKVSLLNEYLVTIQ